VKGKSAARWTPFVGRGTEKWGLRKRKMTLNKGRKGGKKKRRTGKEETGRI